MLPDIITHFFARNIKIISFIAIIVYVIYNGMVFLTSISNLEEKYPMYSVRQRKKNEFFTIFKIHIIIVFIAIFVLKYLHII